MEKTMEKQGTAVHEQTKLLVMTGLFIALGYVATTVLMVPSPTGGYMNLGDTVVLLGAYLLGPEAWALLWRTCWADMASTFPPRWSSRP